MKKMYINQIEDLRVDGLGKIMQDQNKIIALGDSILDEIHHTH